MFKVHCQRNIAIIIKHAKSYCSSREKKKKNMISSTYVAYCLSCRKHTNNIGSNNVTMTNKMIRQKSTCANFMPDKTRFLNQKPNKKVMEMVLTPTIIKHVDIV